jgi:signal transduction histidine kinase
MAELIDDLLMLSRVTSHELRRERVDLSRLAALVATDLVGRDPDRSLRTLIAIDLETEGDIGMLRVVLENLLGNAWKFTAKVSDALVEVGALTIDGVRTFFVRDNGVGFDMRHATRLFQPFQRLHASHEFEGTGIGLATVARIVSRHGGRVWAESSPGLGTTLYFSLTA